MIPVKVLAVRYLDNAAPALCKTHECLSLFSCSFRHKYIMT